MTQRESAENGSRRLSFLERQALEISPVVVNFTLICATLVYVAICLTYNSGTFPLLNGQRDFYYQTSISPFYLASLEVIKTLGLYCGLRAVRDKKGWLLFCVSLVCLLLSGNRGPALTAVALPVLVYMVILPSGRVLVKRIARTGGFKTALIIFGILCIGLVLQKVRSGGEWEDVSSLLSDLLNGNTFSDIRDGAFLLMRFDLVRDGDFVGGLTYLSGLISFIPSSLSEFRDTWAWGRFTTVTLAGWTGTHFGLRGGPFMEAYLNFGLAGLFILGFLQAWVFHKLDLLMREHLLRSNGRIMILVLPIFSRLYSAFTCTSSAYNIYVYIVLLVFLSALSLPYASGLHRRKYSKEEFVSTGKLD